MSQYQELRRHLEEVHRIGGLSRVRGYLRLAEMHTRAHDADGPEHAHSDCDDTCQAKQIQQAVLARHDGLEDA